MSGDVDYYPEEKPMSGQLYRLSKSQSNLLHIIFHDDGTEEVTRGVLVPVTTPLYAVCGRCGGHGETVTDGIGEDCCNCGGGGYVPFNSAAVKGAEDE